MKLLVFPRDPNPYQTLLYRPMQEMHTDMKVKYVTPYPLIGVLLFPLIVFSRRFQGYHVIHIHWPEFNIQFSFLPFQKEFSFLFFIFCIQWLRLLGYKITWTVHNVLPHEPRTKKDLALMQKLASAASAKIVHSSFTIQQMKMLKLDTTNVTVIPHGNYTGVYPDKISCHSARQKLKIKDSQFTILFFGSVRPYKGIDDLLKAFANIESPAKRLIIAGKCNNEGLRHRILEAKKTLNIDFYDDYASKENVATYFKACDIVCLPFKEITTSGSVILALSFGKPVIVPRYGALTDLPDSFCYFYKPGQQDALSQSLAKSIKEKAQLKQKGDAALTYAKMLSWNTAAKQTYNVYRDTLNLAP